MGYDRAMSTKLKPGPAQRPVDSSTAEGRFAANLRKLREAKQWSALQLAEAAGLKSFRIILAYEGARKKPSFDTLVALANALDTDVGTLTAGVR